MITTVTYALKRHPKGQAKPAIPPSLVKILSTKCRHTFSADNEAAVLATCFTHLALMGPY